MTNAALAQSNGNASWSLSQRQKLEILAAILLALFLFALDQTVVGTALPIISTKLNGASLYTWAFTIYLLTATISGPIYGKLSTSTAGARSSSGRWACSWRHRCSPA